MSQYNSRKCASKNTKGAPCNVSERSLRGRDLIKGIKAAKSSFTHSTDLDLALIQFDIKVESMDTMDNPQILNALASRAGLSRADLNYEDHVDLDLIARNVNIFVSSSFCSSVVSPLRCLRRAPQACR